MSRYNKIGSYGVLCSIVALLTIALAPAAAAAKGGPSGGMTSHGSISSHNFPTMKFGGSSANKNLGNLPITKTVGDTFAKKNVGNLPVKKIGSDPLSKKPIDKVGKIGKIGSDPLSKTPQKYPHCNPLDIGFCHHNCCCHPHCHWLFFPLVIEEVVIERVYGEPLYTLYYETEAGVKVFSRYELPSESATLYKTEHALDQSSTSWWLVSSNGQLVDTNTTDKAAALATAAAE